MKLLLTSAGISNKSIKKALAKLLGKKFSESKMVYVPTAANVSKGDKGWLINDLKNCQALGLSSLDIVDISALPKKLILERFAEADILMFGGGNTFYLMSWLKKLGMKKELQKMLKTKIYVGVSAGSMVATGNLVLSDSNKFYFEDEGIDVMTGLGFVDFHIRPHFRSLDYPKLNSKNLKERAKDLHEAIYGIDDDTAIVVVDGKIEVVSEGKWERFN